MNGNISAKQMAKRLNCTESNITAKLRSGIIAGIRTHKGWIVSEADFNKFIKEYVSIDEAERNIAELKKQQNETLKLLRKQVKTSRLMEWIFCKGMDALQHLFSLHPKRKDFSISQLYEKGLTYLYDEKEKEWNLTR